MRDSDLAYNLREAQETKEIERTGHTYEEDTEERYFEPEDQTRDLIVELLELEEKINNIRKLFEIEEIGIFSKENGVKIGLEYSLEKTNEYDAYEFRRKNEDYILTGQLDDGHLEVGEKF